jgi:Tfp pilus assembly protein FimT
MSLLRAAAVLAMLASPVLAQTANNPSAPNSGAGIAGQTGGANGPAVKPGEGQSASSQQSNPATQDTSKIQGKPGGKSGAAVMPPSRSANKP